MSAKKTVVAYEGVPGAYSHMAAVAFAPKAEHRGYASFDEGVEAVRHGEADYALVPVENSTAGRIGYIHLLFGSGLSVVAEHFQPVQHCLIGIKGATQGSVKTVYSHREALAQCKKYINKHNLEAIPYYDTAASVQHILAEGRIDAAAIASESAAKLQKGIVVLAKGVQDNPDNVTRFLIMAKKPVEYTTNHNKLTSVTFKTRDIPASLFKALSGFATTGTNIIKIESFVPMTKHTDASFYLEFEGNPSVYPYSIAMEDLAFHARDVDILGTYPKSAYRKKFDAGK